MNKFLTHNQVARSTPVLPPNDIDDLLEIQSRSNSETSLDRPLLTKARSISLDSKPLPLIPNQPIKNIDIDGYIKVAKKSHAKSLKRAEDSSDPSIATEDSESIKQQETARTSVHYIIDIDNFLAVGNSQDSRKSLLDVIKSKETFEEPLRPRASTFASSGSLRCQPIDRRIIKSAGSIDACDIDGVLALSDGEDSTERNVVSVECVARPKLVSIDVDFVLKVASSDNAKVILNQEEYQMSVGTALARLADAAPLSNSDVDVTHVVSERARSYSNSSKLQQIISQSPEIRSTDVKEVKEVKDHQTTNDIDTVIAVPNRVKERPRATSFSQRWLKPRSFSFSDKENAKNNSAI